MKRLLRLPFISALLGYLIWSWMMLVGKTVRWRIEGEAEARAALAERDSGLIVACWHETILLIPSGWVCAMRCWPERRSRAAMMISLSADGEPVARAVRHFDIDVVRGSSTNPKKARKDKGGLRALAEASQRLKSGGFICMTPDGPRGPRREAGGGAITLAQRSGAAILPYAITAGPVHRLKSWDRFMLPFPFTRGAIVFGALVDCPREAAPETLREALQAGMDAATARAEALCRPGAARAAKVAA